MKQKMNVRSISFIVLMVLFSTMLGQKSYNFGDSLAGFDEAAAKRATLSEGYFGAEFPVHMYSLKRAYVDSKFGIKRVKYSYMLSNSYKGKSAVAPACQNEDFEASTQGQITVSNQIAGWTCDGGSVSPFTNPGADACNLLGCCPNPPSESFLVTAPATGYLDPVIGATYKLYSVFGSGAANPGIATNSQLGIPNMFGNNFIRINDNVNDYSMEKLSKTFAVTANNALFQFAFISVFSTGHDCCNAGAFQIKLTNATTNSVLSCPAFSVSAPSSQCTGTTPVTYYVAGSGVPYNGSNGSLIFNKWKLNTLDLTAYINQNITIDIITSDCTGGGHYGYVYFDAQCSPMNIIGNNSSFPAGTASSLYQLAVQLEQLLLCLAV